MRRNTGERRTKYPQVGSGLGGIALCCVLAILAACGGTSAKGQTTTTTSTTSTTSTTNLHLAEQISVPANGNWKATTTSVRPGERLTIGCNGTVNLPGTSEHVSASGQHSHKASSGAPISGVYEGAVVGRIGSGTPFYVGSFFDHTLVSTTGSGTLNLAVNVPSSSAGSGSFACKVLEQTFSQQATKSEFKGTASVRIYDPGNNGFGGPFNQDVTLGTTTDGSRTLIELTSFPTLKVGPISTSAGNDYITVEPVDVFGAFGPYGPSSAMHNGDIQGLPITLKFTNSLSIAGTCTAPFDFTTGTTTSPDKHFTAAGSPLIATGSVELVGSSKFSCNAFYNPTSGKDVVMTIGGMVSPSPIAYGS